MTARHNTSGRVVMTYEQLVAIERERQRVTKGGQDYVLRQIERDRRK